MATPVPIPRLRPDALLAMLGSGNTDLMPRMRPAPDVLGTGNTNAMPRERPSLLDLIGQLAPGGQQAPPPLPLLLSMLSQRRGQGSPSGPNFMGGPNVAPTYSDTAIRRLRTADRNVRFPQAGGPGGKDGPGRPDKSRPLPPLPIPQIAGRFDGGPPMRPGSPQGLLGMLGGQQSLASGDMQSGFNPQTSPEVDDAAQKQALIEALWRMMLGARIQQAPKPWVRSDDSAPATPEPAGFTTPSGPYR